MTDSSDAKQALRSILQSFLPYHDPVTRLRVRRAARTLIAPGPWDADRADRNEVAQLALLRLLWLQREARKAARRGMFESAALLTRAAIDTCIVCMYCVAVTDAAERINQLNAQNLKSMTEYLPPDFVTREVRDEMVRLIAEPKRDPNTFSMVEAIDKVRGDEAAKMLYRAYYTPLSAFYAHGGGLALLRHVKGDQIVDRPAKQWSRRSTLHIMDSCVGLAAAQLAELQGRGSERFQLYHDSHRERTVTPIATIALSSFFLTLNWKSGLRSIKAGRELRAYIQSDQAVADDLPTREQFVRERAEQTLRMVSALTDPSAFRVAVDDVVRQSLDAIVAREG